MTRLVVVINAHADAEPLPLFISSCLTSILLSFVDPFLFPRRELGYHTVEQLLFQMPDALYPIGGYGTMIQWMGRPDETTKHIQSMVLRQRDGKRKEHAPRWIMPDTMRGNCRAWIVDDVTSLRRHAIIWSISLYSSINTDWVKYKKLNPQNYSIPGLV